MAWAWASSAIHHASVSIRGRLWHTGSTSHRKPYLWTVDDDGAPQIRCEWVQEYAKEAQGRAHRAYDRRHITSSTYHSGDLGLVRWNQPPRGRKPKFSPKYIGPFCIVSRLADLTEVVDLQCPCYAAYVARATSRDTSKSRGIRKRRVKLGKRCVIRSGRGACEVSPSTAAEEGRPMALMVLHVPRKSFVPFSPSSLTFRVFSHVPIIVS